MMVWTYIKQNWERILFRLAGTACFVFGFIFLVEEKITNTSIVFAIGFFSFLYSNLARFKRFKGLGFEAELWEDKQKEAADLIERLKNVVAIYSREVIMGQVMRGRFSSGADWSKNWALFDELVVQHGELGQAIDFSDLKSRVDHVFLFDMCHNQSSALERSIQSARSKARQKIDAEFGSPIRDADGYGARIAQLNAIAFDTEDLFERMIRQNVPEELVAQARTAVEAFQRDFGITLEFDGLAMQNLEKIANWHANRPLVVTSEMLALAEDRPKN